MSVERTCQRCGWQDREPHVRLSLVNLEREARRDGREHTGPDFDHAYRCRDHDACDQRARSYRGEEIP